MQSVYITSCAGGRHNMPSPSVSWPFDLESGVRVMCDVSYLCASFSLAIGFSVLDLGPMLDSQTSDAHHCLMPPTLGRGHNKTVHSGSGHSTTSLPTDSMVVCMPWLWSRPITVEDLNILWLFHLLSRLYRHLFNIWDSFWWPSFLTAWHYA